MDPLANRTTMVIINVESAYLATRVIGNEKGSIFLASLQRYNEVGISVPKNAKDQYNAISEGSRENVLA